MHLFNSFASENVFNVMRSSLINQYYAETDGALNLKLKKKKGNQFS